MKIKKITSHLVDVFVDNQNYPTGFEETNWLRLTKKGNKWVQTHGIKVPSWTFNKIVSEICKTYQEKT